MWIQDGKIKKQNIWRALKDSKIRKKIEPFDSIVNLHVLHLPLHEIHEAHKGILHQ